MKENKKWDITGDGKTNTSKSYMEHLSALMSELSTDSTIPVTVMTLVENHVYALQELLWPYSD